jgi:hypothetical protein
VSCAINGNKQKEKLLILKHKALKWVKTNNALPKKSP